jgi:membrane-associated phospholipid phosphatase
VRSSAALLVCLLLLSSSARADRWDHGERGHLRRTHLLITLGVGGLYLLSSTVFKEEISPDECRWCEPPGFDARARNAVVWDDARLARQLSNATGYAATPILAFGVSMIPLFLESHVGGGDVIDASLPILEAVVLSQSLAQIFKSSSGRQRPYAHFGGLPDSDTQDDNMSFFSGHAALTFSLVTSAGVLAHQRQWRTEPFIWGIGVPLATATAYLRMAGDKHYLSDVVVGALAGIGAGLTVPRFFAHELAVVPAGNGAAVAGRF